MKCKSPPKSVYSLLYSGVFYISFETSSSSLTKVFCLTPLALWVLQLISSNPFYWLSLLSFLGLLYRFLPLFYSSYPPCFCWSACSSIRCLVASRTCIVILSAYILCTYQNHFTCFPLLFDRLVSVLVLFSSYLFILKIFFSFSLHLYKVLYFCCCCCINLFRSHWPSLASIWNYKNNTCTVFHPFTDIVTELPKRRRNALSCTITGLHNSLIFIYPNVTEITLFSDRTYASDTTPSPY